MPRRRYRPLNQSNPEQDSLPRDTVCTILVRQSTMQQRERNLFSAEVHPDQLRKEAIERWGFAPERVQVIDWDMGIGAYTTTIEDRPGLQHWLFELLPSGVSKVLLVSVEDRLFRDRDEVEHNRFIRQVEKYGGWVICGHNVYNFRLDMHRENFRQACKSNRYFIEYQLKRRLHPATQRAAMMGRYTGGPVQLGYSVDYDSRSPTYKRLILYEPHARLVREHVFGYFASLARPTAMEVVRHWERESLVWPFYGMEVDAHVVRAADGCRKRDETRCGYLIHRQQVHRILTDVTYLGWRVRAGEVALCPDGRTPLVCHPPLVDADLFWWCYDRLEAERPPFASPRRETPRPFPRTRRPHVAGVEEVRFLAHGLVRCAQHQRPFAVRDNRECPVLVCNNLDWRKRRDIAECVTPHTADVERALCSAFVGQLTLDERDVAALARLAEHQVGKQDEREEALRKEVEAQKAVLARVMELAVQPENAVLTDELLEQARQAKQTTAEREGELAALVASHPVSSRGWLAAQRAADLAEFIKATFLEWSRAAQAKIVCLALDDALLGSVDRYLMGLWVRWKGGQESRAQFVAPGGKRLRWSTAERDALLAHHASLSWPALQAMLPARSGRAIRKYASELGLVRSGHGSYADVPPCVVQGPPVLNTLADRGFPLRQGAMGGSGLGQVVSRERQVSDYIMVRAS